MAPTFSERLRAVLNRGNLRISDVARVMDRPHSTVHSWANRNLNPSGGPLDVEHVYIMLGKLESLIQRSSKLLPVPPGLSPVDRIRHVKRLRNRILNPKDF